MSECPSCGAPESQVLPAWRREADAYATQPDFIGCRSCHRLIDPTLAAMGEESQAPQRELVASDVANLKIGNQHSRFLSIIEWQCVKGAAEMHGVSDWTSKVDSTLTMEENVGLMEQAGGEETMRERPTVELQ